MGETARGTRGRNAYGSPPINDIHMYLRREEKAKIEKNWYEIKPPFGAACRGYTE
jgi:hypothetical protein